MSYVVNRPIPFRGTLEEAAANYATHRFLDYDGEQECDVCLSKPWHVAASYPCGQEPPRETVNTDDDPVAEQTARFVAYATEL
jgi:hypothetical protein